MKGVRRVLLVAMAIVAAAMSVPTVARERASDAPEIARKVRRALERLPYYGV